MQGFAWTQLELLQRTGCGASATTSAACCLGPARSLRLLHKPALHPHLRNVPVVAAIDELLDLPGGKKERRQEGCMYTPMGVG